MKKARLFLILVIAISVVFVCGISVCSAETVKSGACGSEGDNVKYTLDDSGTLKIFGNGEMKSYIDWGDSPFSEDKLGDVSIVAVCDGVTSIGEKAFGCNVSIKKIEIANSVTDIKDYAIWRCSNLESITIPDSVKYVGINFMDCSNLKTVNIGSGVTNCLGQFSYCENLMDINVSQGNKVYSSIDGVLYNKSNTRLISCPAKKARFSFPAGITFIDGFAFQNCSCLTSISIPTGINDIQSNTFNNCTNLKAVSIPESVTKIGSYAFSGCDCLTDVYYEGSQAQWKEIKVYNENYPLIGATVHYANGEEEVEEENDQVTSFKHTLYSSFFDKATTSLTINNRILLVEISGANKASKASVGFKVTRDSYGGNSIYKYSYLNNGECNLSIDLSTMDDGMYTTQIVFSEGTKSETYKSCRIEIIKGKPLLYIENGKKERDFYNDLATLDPAANNGFPGFALEMDNLDEVVAFTKNIVKDCKTDEDKVKVIHDWLSQNIAYDSEALMNNNREEAGDPAKVFKKRRGICQGYTMLGRVMFGAAGIPSIWISGHVTSSPEGHLWNAVYIDNKWEILDMTWDSWNMYYGENSNNVTGTPATHGYYRIDPTVFAEDHSSECAFTDEDIGGITIDYYSAIGFTVGEEPDFTGYVEVVSEKGDVMPYSVNGKNLIIKGYDKDRLGYQEVTLSYGTWNTKCRVKVLKKGSGYWDDEDDSVVTNGDENDSVVINGAVQNLPSVKITKPKASKKAVTVKWKKVSKKNLKKIKKVQVQVSLDPNFESGVTTKYISAKKTSIKIKKLKSKKKYYMRVRAYTNSGGVVHVSRWSAIKPVKIK